MNRRKFVSALAGLPFLGWLKPTEPDLRDTLYATLSVRGKEYALGIKLTGDGRVDKKSIDLLACSMRETAYQKMGWLSPPSGDNPQEIDRFYGLSPE